MRHDSPQRPKRFWQAEFFSAKDFLLRAVFVVALFLIAHACGLRDYTSFLSGTLPDSDVNRQYAAFLGSVYLILYFATVLGAPILVIAALLLHLIVRFGDRSK